MEFIQFIGIFRSLYGLAESWESRSKKWYEETVEPIRVSFEVVHEDYIRSLHKYLKILQQSKEPIDINHNVWDVILDDSLVSDNLRTRLYEIYELESLNALGEVVNGIKQYLDFTMSDDDDKNDLIFAREQKKAKQDFLKLGMPQTIRPSYIARLKMEFEMSKDHEEFQERAVHITRVWISSLQELYRGVNDSFLSLKRRK
ncbi:hypothetical protein SAMN04488029_0126 [Reichenbachiella faecimaris]|uniref:Uncharacterized protein n=1 Tax=Reichenbachiella faecimaris TaxID=692418 RepID=A0A1W2G528_REIFA|nr:hypothetical protein [Reichenbachiella faecimaris]SMD31789.1 hypothetical protein SAMN04488029_0126 [Reichenbachiella faecimaris]